MKMIYSCYFIGELQIIFYFRRNYWMFWEFDPSKRPENGDLSQDPHDELWAQSLQLRHKRITRENFERKIFKINFLSFLHFLPNLFPKK